MTSSPVPKANPSAPPFAAPTNALGRRSAVEPLDAAAVPVEQRSLVMRLAEEVAILRRALEASHHRIATLEVEASEDPLSGLLNRRAFIREIEKAIAFQARYRMTCGIALVDISGIATIASQHGQATANTALRRIGGIFRAGIRSCDIAARSGNEQFGAVLWNSTYADCAQRVEGLERAIALTEFETALESRSAVIMIEPDMTPEELMAALDAMLTVRPIRR